MTFNALLATQTENKITTSLVKLTDADLMPGDVTVAVDYSTINYKDGLAMTGRGWRQGSAKWLGAEPDPSRRLRPARARARRMAHEAAIRLHHA